MMAGFHNESLGCYKTGIIHSISGGHAVVEFPDLDGLKTKLIPVTQRASGKDKSFSMPKVGDHVACLMDSHFEDGAVIGSIYSDKDIPPATGDTFYFKHEDGTELSYSATGRIVKIALSGGASFKVEPAKITMTVGGVSVVIDSSGLKVTGGDVKADTVSLKTHLTTNIQPGSGLSGVPQA